MVSFATQLGSVYRSKLMVCITFHFAPDRIRYLSEVVRSLSGFLVERMEIIVITNTADAANLNRAAAALPRSTASFKIVFTSATSLSDPFHLAWVHKQFIPTVFLKDPSFTHFIYLEDDMALSFENFCYFCCFRSPLASHGLLPSFLRIEFQESRQWWTSSDNPTPITPDRPRLEIDGLTFIDLYIPYCAIFILDRDLAIEHVQSDTFVLAKNGIAQHWGIREAAAIGQCFVRVPAGFNSRHVVPFLESKVPAGFCCVRHLPANYATSETTPLGKLPTNFMFERPVPKTP